MIAMAEIYWVFELDFVFALLPANSHTPSTPEAKVR